MCVRYTVSIARSNSRVPRINYNNSGRLPPRGRQSAKVSAHAAATGVPIATVFLETIIESPALLLENMRAKVRASPDYYGRDEVAAMDDLRRRCTLYERCADRGMTTGSSRDYRGITT